VKVVAESPYGRQILGRLGFEPQPIKKLPQAGQEPVEAVESRRIGPDALHSTGKTQPWQRYSGQISHNSEVFASPRKLRKNRRICHVFLAKAKSDGANAKWMNSPAETLDQALARYVRSRFVP
jgi:hypothetical protein